jgi:hypothetical protein
VKRPEQYPYSGHGSYLTNGTEKIVETGPVLRLLRGKKSYEKFVLDATGEGHNEEYYEVKDRRFLGDEGFGEDLCREAGEEQSEHKAKKSIETALKKVARRWKIAPGVLTGKDRRWEITKKRAEAVAVLVRKNGYTVTEVAGYLRLTRLSAKQVSQIDPL